MALGLVMALSVRQPVRAQCPVPIAGTLGDVHGDRPVTVVTDVADLLGAQFVSLCTPDADGDPGGGTVTIPGGVDTSVEVRTKAVPWGTMVLARPDLLAVSSDALLTAGPFIGPELQVRVPPMVEKVGAFELPPIMGGWAGEHRSRRPGQGGDLIDLREFAPGDRLRSIHWRAYARHQKLFVRRTQSDADTDFVLCLDTRHEIVPKIRGPLTDWQRYRATLDRSLRDLRRFLMGLFRVAQPTDGRDSSLPRSSVDLTVAAATAVAAAQLKNGDRVGVLDLSNVRRHVRMGSGSSICTGCDICWPRRSPPGHGGCRSPNCGGCRPPRSLCSSRHSSTTSRCRLRWMRGDVAIRCSSSTCSRSRISAQLLAEIRTPRQEQKSGCCWPNVRSAWIGCGRGEFRCWLSTVGRSPPTSQL